METVYISPVEVRVKLRLQYEHITDYKLRKSFCRKINPKIVFNGELREFPNEHIAFHIYPQVSPLEELELINSMINSEDCISMTYRGFSFKGGYGGFELTNPFSNFSL